MHQRISEDIKHKLDNIVNIPTLPQVLGKVTSMLQDPKVSAREVAAIISQDQALVTRVLKIVNSAFYGFARQIKTIDHALVILGFNRLKAAILTASVLEMFRADESVVPMDVAGFWEHSLGVGIMAKSIARHTRIPDTEEFFIAGLLHDVGKLVLAFYASDQYKLVVDKCNSESLFVREAEMQVLGFDHAVVGAWLFEKYNMPIDLVDVAGFHHSVTAYPGRGIQKISVVSLADMLARAMRIGNGGDTFVPDVSENILDMLNIDIFDVEAIIKLAMAQLSAANDFLNVIRGAQ